MLPFPASKPSTSSTAAASSHSSVVSNLHSPLSSGPALQQHHSPLSPVVHNHSNRNQDLKTKKEKTKKLCQIRLLPLHSVPATEHPQSPVSPVSR
ncbi:hypothetical protein Ancab_001065 [Ancistrocladus abbreviatus]